MSIVIVDYQHHCVIVACCMPSELWQQYPKAETVCIFPAGNWRTGFSYSITKYIVQIWRKLRSCWCRQPGRSVQLGWASLMACCHNQTKPNQIIRCCPNLQIRSEAVGAANLRDLFSWDESASWGLTTNRSTTEDTCSCSELRTNWGDLSKRPLVLRPGVDQDQYLS